MRGPDGHREIRSLTGMRGVAALAVVLYHLDLGQDDTGLVQHIIHHGYLAVDLFFVLSGFIMALTYSHVFVERFNINKYWKFLNHRIARIYPLYIFSTLLCFFLFVIAPGPIRMS